MATNIAAFKLEVSKSYVIRSTKTLLKDYIYVFVIFHFDESNTDIDIDLL